ncbi:DNA primase [Thalassorhabdomicrobium marinisediminis]|uniref:DNA primase n=1 Tax=Thalassorhabdomicrobium marinisediminis TaxID=2170577 RepID=A0A2T7FXI3_9RHOB|nr:DNA primase [Thalassorhabdomicrobium marinisediminis]PVA06875.1 DNA primase [Thalassorhabdomicrobium marinisediminis]
MSLPPGFLDELRNRLSIGQVVGRKVMWDQRKSNQGKGDLWAPCPFHQEKSASFHVDDRKGYYYCFGCHAKGDAISFVRETENVGFMEAVEILAGEAGMTLPKRDPQAQQKADRRTQLAEVMEMAVQFFRLQLKTGAGAEARSYLAGRGLDAGALDRWEIGLAPPGWQNLWDHLTGKGVAENLILGAGLAKASQQGRKPYDTFRHRIMFPIRDARGRAIAFGGRAMDPDDNAKYLNSPETELFDKGRNLFNLKPAREAAGKGQPLVVAEGYMDVIALSEAGFEAAVAPLGTAVTDTQLQMMWRAAAEPVIMLDGDAAGQKAAMRVIDLALPLLEAGQSVRFAMMPEGQDPDDLLKSAGSAALRERIEGAVPMVQLLWQREVEGRVFDSPERRAALDKALREKISQIKDPSIRSHYGQAIKDLRWELFGQSRRSGAGGGGGFGGPRPQWVPKGAKPTALASTKTSLLVASDVSEDHLREAVILAVLIRNPLILDDFYSALERMRCSGADNSAICAALLRHDSGDGLETRLAEDIGTAPLEKLFAQAHVAITPAVRRPDNGDLARMCLIEEFAKLTARRGHAHEVEDAIAELSSDMADERLTARLAQSIAAMNNAGRQDDDDSAEYDTSNNGARIKKEERSAFDTLLGKIDFAKGGRGH